MDQNHKFEDYNPLSSSSDDSFSVLSDNKCELDLNLSDIEIDDVKPITIKLSHLSPFLNDSNPQVNSEIEQETALIQRKKRNKEDLNKTPLPLFDCIYCSNDAISFKHFSSLIISFNYLYMTSVYDIAQITKLISFPIIYSKFNNVIESVVIDNTEYLNDYCSFNKSELFFQSNSFKQEIVGKEQQKLLKSFPRTVQGLLTVSIRKSIQWFPKAITKRSDNGKANEKANPLSNSNNLLEENNDNNTNGKGATRSNCLNANGHNSTFHNFSAIIGDNYNNSSLNVNSLSLNYNNDIGNSNANVNNINCNCCYNNGNIINNNNNILKQVPESVSIVKSVDQKNDQEDDDDYQEDFFNFLKFGVMRKVSRKDIEWESEPFDIWNPIFNFNESETEAEAGAEVIKGDNEGKKKFLAKSDRPSPIHFFNNSALMDTRIKNISNERRQFIQEFEAHDQNSHMSFNHNKGLTFIDSPPFKSASSIQSRLQEFINDYSSNHNSKSSKLFSTQCESKLSVNTPKSILSFINYKANSSSTHHYFNNLNSIALVSNKSSSQKDFHLENIKGFSKSIFDSNQSNREIQICQRSTTKINKKENTYINTNIKYNNYANDNSRMLESSFAKKKNELIDLICKDIPSRHQHQYRNRINILPTTTPKRISRLTRTKVNARSVLFSPNKISKNIHY